MFSRTPRPPGAPLRVRSLVAAPLAVFLAGALPLSAQEPSRTPSPHTAAVGSAPAPTSPQSGSVATPVSASSAGPLSAPSASFEDAPAFTAASPAARGGAAAPVVSGGPTLVTVVGGTLGVLALLAGFLALLKRWSPSRTADPGRTIRLLAKQTLDPRHQLWLVEVGRKIFLIGTTKDGFSRLGELSGPEETAGLRGAADAAGPGSAAREFDEALKRSLKAHEGIAPEAGAMEEKAGDVLSELAGMRKTVESWKVG